jgi:hypothetical protein
VASGVGRYTAAASGAQVAASLVNGRGRWLVYGGGIGRRLVYGGGVGRSGRGFAYKRLRLVNGGGDGRRLWYTAVASGGRVAALLVNGHGW